MIQTRKLHINAARKYCAECQCFPHTGSGCLQHDEHDAEVLCAPWKQLPAAAALTPSLRAAAVLVMRLWAEALSSLRMGHRTTNTTRSPSILSGNLIQTSCFILAH